MRAIAIVLVLFSAAACVCASTADLGADLVRIRAFARAQGDSLWPGLSTAAFDFLLISADQETLLCRDDVPAGFVSRGIERASGCRRFARARSGLPDTLLAAMPVFGPPATIVMGTPQSTGRSRAEWLRTILHEHFHQWQMALPDYFQRVAALGLQHGDTDRNWMLDYPFPYDDAAAGHAYAVASMALADALAARATPGFSAAYAEFLSAREAFAASVPADAWRYLDFETWQEGAARWTEIELGKRYPDAAVRKAAGEFEQRTLERLRHPDLREQRRELVYPFGAAEIMLIDACGPEWRQRYPRELSLTPLLDASLARCRMGQQSLSAIVPAAPPGR